jgi:hypothetical protein
VLLIAIGAAVKQHAAFSALQSSCISCVTELVVIQCLEGCNKQQRMQQQMLIATYTTYVKEEQQAAMSARSSSRIAVVQQRLSGGIDYSASSSHSNSSKPSVSHC